MDIERINHSDVSTICLETALEPESVIEKLSHIPQSELLLSIYGAAKGGAYNNADYFLTSSLSNMYYRHRRGATSQAGEEYWDEATLGRILNGNTDNLEEAEFMHLWNVRSALTVLAYRCLWASNVPPEIQSRFSTSAKANDPNQPFGGDSAHLNPDEFADARDAVSGWFSEHRHLDTPLVFDEAMRQQTARVGLTFNDLVRLYDDNRAELLRFMPQERYQTSPTYNPDAKTLDRLLLLEGMFAVFGTAHDYAQLMDLWETFDGLIADGWFNYRELSEEQRQFERQWRDWEREWQRERE